MRELLTCSLAAAAALAAGPLSADAQDRPSAAVLETEVSGAPADTGGAVDRMIRARLDGLDVVRTASGVALDLSEVQLALGCVGETPECLGPVANELNVQVLLIPHLDEADGELILTIARFDREAGTIERVVRQASGEQARTQLLDAIEGQLRELFGLPPPVEPPPVGGDPVEHPPPSGGLSAGPFILLGVGAAALGVGIGLGVAASDADSEYRNLPPPETAQDATDAGAVYSRWETFAITADVLFVAGGLAAAGGLAWLIIELTSQPSSGSTAVTPVLGPGLAGLSVSGTWGAR